jgi:alpha-D-ribose 1-methylphosphonate 5-triphosphate synthase subunit PhnL
MLIVESLGKEFMMHIKNGKKIIGFKNVSFELHEGEFLGITGQSGIGKSSLLKCIYRTYIPTEGNIFFKISDKSWLNICRANDHEILKLRMNDIGYISQFFNVIPRVSAIDILVKELSLNGYDADLSLSLAKEYLKRLNIRESWWEMYPSTFSGGEKQRLNIIHGIIKKPRLLLLDEPTASLDPKSKDEVIKLIKSLKNQGVSMIGVFHDYDTLEKLADVKYDLGSLSLKKNMVIK